MMRALAPLALLLLAACNEEAAPAAQGDKAAGEVLGGTISDAMIPLDQLQSEAPLAPRQGPAAPSLDAEQPEVSPAPGIEDGADSAADEGGAAAGTAPAPVP